MRKSIFPIFAILASSLIPMSANADLSDQYDDPKGSCAQIYKNPDRSYYACLTSKGNVYRYNYSTSTIGDNIGKLGEMKLDGGCSQYACVGEVKQFKKEGGKLVEYSCYTAGPGSSKCKDNVSRYIWSPYK